MSLIPLGGLFDMGRPAQHHTPAGIYRIFILAAETVVMHRRPITAHAAGLAAEDTACAALVADGWTIRGRRLRTAAGEIDAVAERDGVLAIVEVKHRPTLAEAAAALSERQKTRLLNACDIVLAEHPEWGCNGVRFDVLVVDALGRVRRISDAFRDGD